MWTKLWKAIDREDLLTDERTRDDRGRFQNGQFIMEELARVFAAHPRDHWLEKLSQHEVPAGPVYAYQDLEADSHMWENGYLKTVPHSRFDNNVVINVPVRFHSTPAGVQANAPDLGEHTQEVLSAIAGLSKDEIAALESKGVTKPM